MKAVNHVAIVGAGPAGSALALALRRKNIKVTLLGKLPQRPAIGESLPARGLTLLKLLSVDVSSLIGCCYEGNHSYWGQQCDRREFSEPGLHLDRGRFDQMLFTQALAAGVEYLEVDQPLCLLGDRQLQLGNQIVEADLLVDASGRRAWLGQRMGARKYHLDQQIALTCELRLDVPTILARDSLLDSREIGWWYISGLPNPGVQLTLFSDKDLVDQRLKTSEGFAYALQQCRWWCHFSDAEQACILAPLQQQQPVIYSAASQYLDRIAGTHWLGIGDAVACFDPLSSAGICNALEDALVVAGLLPEWQFEQAQYYASRAYQSLQRFLIERQRYYALTEETGVFWQRRSQICGLNTEVA